MEVDVKVLSNRKIKRLFLYILLIIIIFAVILSAAVTLKIKNLLLWVSLSFFGMGISVLTGMYLYFRDQNKIMEEAVEQISDYISGNKNARIECDDEGELYRLFHEVNSLVSILNAHAENEGRSKNL